jgi:hypothetical protein
LRLRRHCSGRRNDGSYGIWYARNELVKALRHLQVPKTPAT